MSKAFINNDDAELDDDELSPQLTIPAGAKNYITPGGFSRLKGELHELLHKKRPEMTATVAWAASNGDRSENADYIYGKRRLRQIDARIRFLTKRLEIAEVVDPAARPAHQSDRVFFGATVTIREEAHEQTCVIVGVDEIDPAKNHISWTSPLARVLLKASVGDVVHFQTPKGLREVEVVAIHYQSIAL